MELKYVIGERLRLIREHFNETQRQFAERLEIKQGLISKYERAELELPDYIKEKLSNLGISQNWLICGIGDMFIAPPTLGKRLEEARRYGNFSIEGFAAALNVDIERYKLWEADEEEPPVESLKVAEKWTGKEYRWILSGKSDRSGKVTGELTEFERAFPDVQRMWKQWQEYNQRLAALNNVEGYYKNLDDKGRELVEAYVKALFDSKQSQ